MRTILGPVPIVTRPECHGQLDALSLSAAGYRTSAAPTLHPVGFDGAPTPAARQDVQMPRELRATRGDAAA